MNTDRKICKRLLISTKNLITPFISLTIYPPMTLEQLLNKLIELWWKPRDMNLTKIEIDEIWPIFYWIDEDGDWGYCPNDNSINDLCSLDSWLRQFVCEKGLYDVWDEDKKIKYGIVDFVNIHAHNQTNKFYPKDIWYWTTLSSIQKDKTQFLLDNIKLEWTKKD